MKKNIHQDVWIALLIFAACAVSVMLNKDLAAGSAAMPLILTGLMAFLGVIILIGGLKKSSAGSVKKYITWDDMKYPLIGFAYIAAYICLFWFAGYFAATPIMLVAMMRFLKMKSWRTIIIITVVYTAVIYLFFVKQMHVSIDNFGWIGTYIKMH